MINERQLYRHRQRAGNRIGDNKTVDLLRYCAWMHQVRHSPRQTNDADPYERMKESARARNAALALAGRDIGEIPVVENPDRKDRTPAMIRTTKAGSRLLDRRFKKIGIAYLARNTVVCYLVHMDLYHITEVKKIDVFHLLSQPSQVARLDILYQLVLVPTASMRSSEGVVLSK